MFKKIKIDYLEEKKKLLAVGVLLLLALFCSFYLLNKAFAYYTSSVKLKSNIDKALYILNKEDINFNIDSSKIIPSDTPYTYTFSISNYNSSEHSDIDLEYEVKVITTTNLPLTIKLYKNDDLDNSIVSEEKTVKDSDNSWYRLYKTANKEVMNYQENVTNVYTLSILFPKEYASNTTYAEAAEAIEIQINSWQIV